MRLRLLPRGNLAASRCCDAIATSANAGLVGNANPNFWRFTGRLNADGEIHAKAGPKLLAGLPGDCGERLRALQYWRDGSNTGL